MKRPIKRESLSHRAFTLVELLVVIAIITILIAILLPVVAGVKRQAMEVRCATNLRALGQAQMLYLQEYHCYPDATFELSSVGNSAGGFGAAWPARLRKLVRADRKLFYCPAQDPRCQWNDDNPGRVLYAEEIHVQFGYEVGDRILLWSPSIYGSWFSYGSNTDGCGGGPGFPGRGVGGAIYFDHLSPRVDYKILRRPGAIRASADFIVMGDTTADGHYDFSISGFNWGGTPGKTNVISNHHRGGANILFGDGHVQWRLQKDLLVKTPVVPEEAAKQCMWNIDNKPSRPW
jgi:prepilin-type N-terminal cleavage/methylation domain-containing protein/prepilin-type processing-associated H-X9-DG protein